MKTLFVVLLSSLCWAETYKDFKIKAFSENEEMNVRWNAVVKMAELKKSDSLTDLKKALKSNVWYMRNVALLAIESIDADAAFDAAKKQLDDPALVVRSAAVEVIAKNKKRSEEGRKLLWKELHDKQNRIQTKSLWIREQIAKHLSEEPRKDERQNFLNLVEDKDQNLRSQGELALSKIQNAL